MKHTVKDIYMLDVHWCKEGLGISGRCPPPLLLVGDRSTYIPPHTFTPEQPASRILQNTQNIQGGNYQSPPTLRRSVLFCLKILPIINCFLPVFPNLLAECLFPNVLLERDWVWCGIWRQLESAEERELNIHGQYEGIAPNNITHNASRG